MNYGAIIEGLLFVVGEEGLTLDQLQEILDLPLEDVKVHLSALKESYEKENRGIRINFLGNTFKLTTKKEHKVYYQRLIENPATNVLSQSALETLAIIAYNEPVTRIEVDEIRGVSSAQMMRKLASKGLIKEVGRSEALGRPILYKTTSEFLDYFGLATLEDLPKFEDFMAPDTKEEETEMDLYHSKYQEQTVEVEEL